MSSGTTSEWRRSSYSGSASENCVEVRYGSGVSVRDSRRTATTALDVSAPRWAAFVERLREG